MMSWQQRRRQHRAACQVRDGRPAACNESILYNRMSATTACILRQLLTCVACAGHFATCVVALGVAIEERLLSAKYADVA